MKRKLLIVVVLVVLALSLFVISVSAKEYSPTSSAELTSAITEINGSTEENTINLGGSYTEGYSDSGYEIKTTTKLTFNLTSDVEIRCRFNLTASSTVEFNLNGYKLNNTVGRGGDSGCQFLLNNSSLKLKINNGTINIHDVCFWSYAGNLECNNVDFTANEELIWSGGSGQNGYITFKDCNVASKGEAAFKFKLGSCSGNTRVFTIENCTFDSIGGLLIQCPAAGSVVKDCTVKQGSFIVDSWHAHTSSKESPAIFDNITVEAGNLSSLTSSEIFTFTNCKAQGLNASGDNSGGCTIQAIDCEYSEVSFGNTNKDKSNIITITSQTCLDAGTKTTYPNGSTDAVVDEQYPIDNPALGHGFDANDITNIEYKNGYMSAGLCTSNCVRCDVAGIIEEESSASPLFSSLGYSKPENGTIGVAVSFKVNKDAIEIYEGVTSKSLEYGAVAAAYDNLGGKTLLDDNGNINTLEKGGVIKAPVSQANVTSLTLKITGFTKEEHKDVKLVLGAYVIVTEADATTVSYLQVTKPAEGYSYITYNEIQA